MEFNYVYNYLMLIGTLIFVPAFAFQAVRILLKGKHSFNFSRVTWIVNYIGRYLWIVFGILTHEELIIIGQGIVTLLTITIMYYTLRNHKTSGEYKKENFHNGLFSFRVILSTITFATIILGELSIHNVINQVNVEHTLTLVIVISATIFTSYAFFPQGIKTIKNNNTKSTAFLLTIMFAVGNSILILALLMKVIEGQGTIVENIGGIVLPTISTLLMYVISFIKLKNIIKLKEAW